MDFSEGICCFLVFLLLYPLPYLLPVTLRPPLNNAVIFYLFDSIVICTFNLAIFNLKQLNYPLYKRTDSKEFILGTLAEEDVKMDPLVDQINAYTYLYPVELPSNKFLFKWYVLTLPVSALHFKLIM